MNKEERDAILEDAFGWLNEIKVHDHNGKKMLGDDNNPYNVASVMYEKDFVKNWMMCFAVGNSLGQRYNKFPISEWSKLSAAGTKSVLIVDDNHKPVILVQPLISHNMGPEELELLRQVAFHIKQIQADQVRKHDPNASMGLAKAVKENIKNERKTYTDLVPAEFFEKHGVIPKVEQQVYFIKDVVNQGRDLDLKDLDKARDILYRDHRNQKVTEDEYKFIHKLSDGHFEIEAKIGKQATTPNQEEKPFNPLEC